MARALTQRHRDTEVAKVRLGEVVSESSCRNRDGRVADVYSVTNSGGFIPSTEYFSKEVFSKNVTTYKIVEPGMFAYNPSRINVGSVNCWCGGKPVIVSPLYVVVKTDDSRIQQKYLNYFLHSSVALNQIRNLTSGTVRDSLKFAAFSKLEIPLPSLSEQKRIAGELDRICELKKNAEERLELMDQLVKSKFVEMFGDLRINTKNWPRGCVKDLAEYWNGLTYKPTDVTDNGIVVLRSSNIQAGVLDMSDIVRVSVDAKAKNIVKPNDILMCSRNGSAALVGKTAIIPAGIEKMYFGAFMMIIRGRYPEFLNSFFRSSAFRSQLSCAKTSTVNQITCSMMDGVVLPIPPEPLMVEFADFVSSVDKSKAALKETIATMETLYKERLQEYFS